MGVYYRSAAPAAEVELMSEQTLSDGLVESNRLCRRRAGLMASAPQVLCPLGGVSYGLTRCPFCNSKDTRTTKTMPPAADGTTIRYHKCGACGKNFKSHEPKD